jgi:serine/threonine protein kinase
MSPQLPDHSSNTFRGAERLIRELKGTEGKELQPGRKMGEYTIREKFAEGGMGEVYLATHRYMSGVYALKVIRHDTLQTALRPRFQQEVLLTSRLQGFEGIVHVQEAADVGGLFFYTMKFIDGPSLETLLGDQGALPSEGAAKYVEQVARNLDRVHCEGIIHRDIKPDNVRLNNQGKPLLVDFGLATGLDESGEGHPSPTPPPGNGLTAPGEIPGTPGYIAPECYRTPYSVSPVSDVFSLGVTLFRLLCGEFPFGRPHPTRSPDEFKKFMNEAAEADRMPLRRKDVPVALENICLKCLATDPAGRYDSAAALADDLKRFLTDKTSAAPGPFPPDARDQLAGVIRRHKKGFQTGDRHFFQILREERLLPPSWWVRLLCTALKTNIVEDLSLRYPVLTDGQREEFERRLATRFPWLRPAEAGWVLDTWVAALGVPADLGNEVPPSRKTDSMVKRARELVSVLFAGGLTLLLIRACSSPRSQVADDSPRPQAADPQANTFARVEKPKNNPQDAMNNLQDAPGKQRQREALRLDRSSEDGRYSFHSMEDHLPGVWQIEVRTHDPLAAQSGRTLKLPNRVMALSAHGPFLLFKTDTGVIHVWKWADFQEQRSKVLYRRNKEQPMAEDVDVTCARAQDERRILWGDNRGVVRLFDYPTGKERASWACDPARQPVKGVSFNGNDQPVAELANGTKRVLVGPD